MTVMLLQRRSKSLLIVVMLALMLSTTLLTNVEGGTAHAASRRPAVAVAVGEWAFTQLVICIGNSATAFWYVGGSSKGEGSPVRKYITAFSHAVDALAEDKPRSTQDDFMLGACLGAFVPFIFLGVSKITIKLLKQYVQKLINWLNDPGDGPPPPADGGSSPNNGGNNNGGAPGNGGTQPEAPSEAPAPLPPVEFVPLSCSSSDNCAPVVVCPDSINVTTASNLNQCPSVMCVDGSLASSNSDCSANPFVSAAATQCADGTVAPSPGDLCDSGDGGVAASGDAVCIDGSSVPSADQCNTTGSFSVAELGGCPDGSTAMYSDQCATADIASGSGDNQDPNSGDYNVSQNPDDTNSNNG